MPPASKFTPMMVILMLMAMLAGACGGGGAAGADVREVQRALRTTADEAHVFEFVDETLDGDQRVLVEGQSEDDFRFSAIISLAGKKLYEQMVSDDSVALRMIDPEATAVVVKLAQAIDKPTAEALGSGEWVVDHTAAQALAPPREARERTPFPDDPFVGTTTVIAYAQRAVGSSVGVDRFDPEGIEYNPIDDPWREDAQVDLDGEGIRRFDVIPPSLPARAERGARQMLPEIQHFRKMAVYTTTRKVTEIREQVSIRDRREFRRAEEGRAADYFVELRDAALRGAVADRFRQRQMRYRVVRAEDVSVRLPGDAVPGLLQEVLGPKGLGSLFSYDFIGGEAPAVPGFGFEEVPGLEDLRQPDEPTDPPDR